MDGVVGVAWLGLVAGLAVAVPLGPVGLLVLERGMRHGRPVGLAAAGGVAFVDLLYAAAAVALAGGASTLVDPVRTPAGVVAAVVLAGLGVRALLASVGEQPSVETPDAPGRAWPTFAAFVGLTLLNPATLLYFAALAVGLADRLAGAGQRTAFVLAVGIGSLLWQAALALLGTRLGRVDRPGVQRWTRRAGGVLLVGFALLLLLEVT